MWLYPRLPRPVAERLAARLKRIAPTDRVALAFERHGRAAVAPTGGPEVPVEHLQHLADSIRAAFAEEMRDRMKPGSEARVDARLGRLLHDKMAIIVSDAAHEGVWSFLSVVLLPDVTTWRFPDCHPSRLVGTPRNALRRTWWRQHVLGDIIGDAEQPIARPLGEDELVGIFERSRMARSHELARCIARYILSLDLPDRSSFSRELAKRIRRLLAYVNVDSLERGQIESLVAEAGQAVRAVRTN